ncbi:MAG: helix-turn-helix domain-containing protein [Roseateles sp.]|uniref:TetR/AcrR family transcriptional regulator n=1 Tax=Roseateles sp. TaxID=1971397 RepID=UPI0039ECD980
MRADARKNYDHLLAVAREVFTEQGADASLRDIARRAEVGLGTLYRHFPTREALLEALLRSSFNALAARADELQTADDSAAALMLWLRETVAFTHENRGVIAPMVSAIEDHDCALHASCVTLRAAGAALLARAQADGNARADLDGSELFDLIAALAWLREQPSHAPRSDRIFGLIADVILVRHPRPEAPNASGHTGRQPKGRS